MNLPPSHHDAPFGRPDPRPEPDFPATLPSAGGRPEAAAPASGDQTPATPPTRPPAEPWPETRVSASEPGTGPGETLPAGLPSRVGRYLLGEEVGRGGMGVVQRAHDTAFNRSLAVKVLLPGHAGDARLEQRFLEEAQVMGQLQHPGVPPVHDVGRLEDGRLFLAMKLIKGRTLADLLRERRSPAEDLPRFLAVFGQLCQAVAYAHSRGVLHRDLKPSNVMVGAFGEVQVMDWGLAKVLGGERPAEQPAQEEKSVINTLRTATSGLETQAGAVVGTPAYMAPEQARGETDRLDERADVFGVGAILCSILTGGPPFQGATTEQVHRRAARGDLDDAFARLDQCGADAELVRLARACLARDAAERPRDAGAVAAAVAAYQAGVQERLRQAEMERAQAEIKAAEERKRRRLTLALAASLLLLVVGASVAGLGYQRVQADRAAEKARQEEKEASQRAREVELALQEATTLEKQTLTASADLHEWEVNLKAALSALRRADNWLDPDGAPVDADLREQVLQVKDRLEAAERDRRLAATSDAVQLAENKLDADERRPKRAEALATLRKALTDYGLAPRGVTPERAAGHIARRPRVVQGYVVAVLDDCLRLSPGQERKEREWLRDVLARLDPDPWRGQVRAALARQDQVALAKLARDGAVDKQPPSFLARVAKALLKLSGAGNVSLLRRAQQRHPEDFLLNLSLALALYESVPEGTYSRKATPEELLRLDEAGRVCTVAAALRPSSSVVYFNLGKVLFAKRDLDGALAAYRKCNDLSPDSAAYNNLGNVLSDKGDLDGALAAYRRAIELDPKDAAAHGCLGLALIKTKDTEGAIAAFGRAIEADPKFALARDGLSLALQRKGVALSATGDDEGAIAACRKAIELDPRNAGAHIARGAVLFKKGDLASALVAYRRAVELNPQDATAHASYGNALKRTGDLDGAIAELRRAIELDPKDADTHGMLGYALSDKGNWEGAIAAHRRAIELDPNNAHFHGSLGLALGGKGDWEGAIAAYRKAIALDPKDALVHSNLGFALCEKGDLDGAVAAYRKAIELDPKHATAHGALALPLLRQGKFAEAKASTQRALDLSPPGHPMRPQFFMQTQQYERILEASRKLPGILKGEQQPANPAEQLALAELCQHTKRYAAAARFYAAVMADARLPEPLRQQHRYNAACAVLLVAAGKGEDAGKVDDRERARLRGQALGWLRAELEAGTAMIEHGPPQARVAVRHNLLHWRKDLDLVSVRDKAALAKLPQEERAAWQKLWADADALLQKAGVSK